MVMVCQEHVTRGLHILPAPHVKEISKSSKKCCSFCNHEAKYELFILNSSTQFTFLKENQQKAEMDNELLTTPVSLKVTDEISKNLDRVLV
ncbi:hypothetical protein JMM81_08060 [Bacillus sp. V3B]|uniref:hypothetical protein n=1 Tax=Bacillus sp. V3B TaxID=2804915 RepID=UPI00210D9991|nr:hypothetical protein [Bacillus sp. V3B]MCQ6274917.1 hypothetical protein [Bacillus sp. V3B]